MREFCEGDLVVIKDWDEMAYEYGYTGSALHIINCNAGFAATMMHLCGQLARIKRIKGNDRVELEFLHKNDNEKYDYYYSLDMINLYDEINDDYKMDESSLINFISGGS